MDATTLPLIFCCLRNAGLCLLLLISYTLRAQTEFPKEFIMHLRLTSGMITEPKPLAPAFTGALQLVPQLTLVEHTLRGGLILGGSYSNRQTDGFAGPTVSLKLLELKGSYFGSLGNLHLNADHLWGTGSQRLVGGGLNLDLLNRVVLSLSSHRDYHLHQWWLQTGIAFRITPVKTPAETFPH